MQDFRCKHKYLDLTKGRMMLMMMMKVTNIYQHEIIADTCVYYSESIVAVIYDANVRNLFAGRNYPFLSKGCFLPL